MTAILNDVIGFLIKLKPLFIANNRLSVPKIFSEQQRTRKDNAYTLKIEITFPSNTWHVAFNLKVRKIDHE